MGSQMKLKRRKKKNNNVFRFSGLKLQKYCRKRANDIIPLRGKKFSTNNRTRNRRFYKYCGKTFRVKLFKSFFLKEHFF